MAPVDLFCFLFFSHLVIILSAGYGNGHQDCPHSFTCGHLGTFYYPFTKAEQPHCGLLPIHDCDNPHSPIITIQLEKNGKNLELNGITQQNAISILDEDFHKSLQQNTCGTLNNNYSLPSPSPLYSIYIKYNVTLFRCKQGLKINQPPKHYLKYPCHGYEYDIYYDSLPSPNNEEAHNLFSSCSVFQLPSKDKTDTKDILSFVTAEMVLQVLLSNDCDECYNHRGGQCRLDSNQKFYCDTGSKKSKDKILKLKLILGLVTGLSVIFSVILIIGCIRKHSPSNPQSQSRNRHTDVIDPRSNPDPENGRVYFGIPLFSYKELEEATYNFHHARQLGSGGFGTVYYGKLRDGREVAVKRLYEHNCRRVEQFMNEVHILTRLRHRNLVSLYGCTSRQSHELLLVYEHVPNGTVACHLHGDLARRGTLPWHIRMKIAIETASALAYLHASDTIHRDVKTMNILLNESFSVKVADFGLSRLFPNDVTHVSTAPLGTPGYVDPEYHQCYQLTNKSDVYSFGVVLIELVSSKPAIDMNRHRDEINLSSLAIKKIQQSAFSELVDPSLGFDSDIEVKRMMVSVAELAFQCLQRDKELRPSMDEVLKVLMRIESGKDMAEHMDEEDLRPPSLPSPDWDENPLFKKIMAHPSPKAVTDTWHSQSTTPNVSA
ncbi:LEAF RUST 10 DISEASE-RESISTANCE LOCUS RECEPTOR-LIKE PROTEIN KINASE-like 1.1 [Cajanus cajan]|uniref:LEAF RUST 10 DISEASE-RESISTANCE LOCUS RECEPTOR-LIKE PROTEIN KINASE-like 1.1 n=1 Tax=Cajanus cajan TaxID=3821 RepID=UPI00098DD0F8|nr:LEAF RUST 10 DISEASE-RESISTANCE LOCUS RECEPTOR-LIKE PROTEIN KINASE-like 1.1 [Cajanus cajan]